MRTIKFKGKRIDNDEWVHGAIHPNGIFIYEEKQFTWVQIEPKTVGQFTEMNDQCAWFDPFWCNPSECDGCASFIRKENEQQLTLEL